MKSFDIAFLLGFPEISGGTNVILEHAIGLGRLGHKVSIVTETPIDPQRFFWKPEAMKLPLLCHAECAGRVFDISIATWWRNVYDLPFVPARTYAYFCQSIESRFFHETDPDMKALIDYTYRQPIHIVTEAGWIARYLRENYQRDVALVLNGIDKSIFRPDGEVVAPRPAEGIRVLVEGSMGVSFKRVELTIELCQKAGMKDIWLLTPTECKYYPGVARVFSKVPIKDVGAIYRSCDVLVKLSTVEGMFGPPLEMMLCGGTAITSDVTGHEEYMAHGANGIVIRRGEEMEVVEYLRALERDRAFLCTLKDGARKTGEAWPEWPAAVANMEQALAGFIGRDRTGEAAYYDAMQQLRAALKLAGPLHDALKRRYSPKALLRLLKATGADIARQRTPRLYRWMLDHSSSAKPVPEKAEALPEFRDIRVAPREKYRICFIGDENRHACHATSGSERIDAIFVHAPDGLGREQLRAIEQFSPSLILSFDPEKLDPEVAALLPAPLAAHTCAAPAYGNIDLFRRLFPITENPRAALFHIDPAAAAELLRKGINAPGSFLLPCDARRYGVPLSFEQWRAREISILYVGPSNASTRACLRAIGRLKGFMRIDPEYAADESLRSVLANSKMVLHLDDESNPAGAAKVIRDMMSGCLVLAGKLAVDYQLLPGEHYVYFGNESELEDRAAQILRLPDDMDVIRRNGWERARQFDAAACYASLIERHFANPLKTGAARS